MYKKSRNKKIAIGVGIGAGIAVKHRLDQLKAEDRKNENQIKWWHEHDEKERKEREKERLERKEQEKRKQDENERIRNDNAGLIKQLQKEIGMYTKQLVANKELLKKIEKQLDDTDKEINNMKNKMGSDELVNSVYNDTIAGLERSKERIYKTYRETKKAIENCETEIWRRNNKLDKIDL
jgi:chromosome segregation ATPase